MTTARSHRALLALAAGGGLAAGASVLYVAARSRPDFPHRTAPIPPGSLPEGRIELIDGLGEVFVRDTGSPNPNAPVILLLHGWMFPADLNWFTCYEPLAELGRVIAVDHRGHGRGLRPSRPFRLTDAADDAAAVLRHLGARPAVVVGYSMGGPVAQLLWRRHPDLVRGLVLCATSATFNVTARDRWLWRGMGALQLALRLAPRHWWESLAERQAAGQLPVRVSRMINDSTPDEVLSLLPWIVGELSRGSAEDIAEAGRELGRYDARAWIDAVDVPSAVVITTRDELVPYANQQDLAQRILGCAVHEVALDHDGVAAHPDVFLPALLKAVSGVLGD